MASIGICRRLISLLPLTFALALSLNRYVGAATHPQPSNPGTANKRLQRSALRLPADPFRPSNVQTTGGEYFTGADFISATRCAKCHQDTYRSWSESLHRHAGIEPFYNKSVELLRHSSPVEFTRHCEGCHLPVALISGTLKTGRKARHLFDGEGVTCSVCHSIVDARLEGTGSYTIAKPALLVTADGKRIRDASDANILGDLESHRRAVMPPLLRKPEFCAVCHKSAVPPDLSGYDFMQRGFDVYDEWQQSEFSGETIRSLRKTSRRKTCQSCHMEPVASSDDYGATDGHIASHRWRGANTAVPLLYGHRRQAEAIRDFLQAGVVDVDLFAVTNQRTGVRLAPLDREDNVFEIAPGDSLTVEAIVASDGIGHSFPPELRDLFETWVELDVRDADNRLIYRSPGLNADGHLDLQAHAYRQILLNRAGEPLTRHEVWLAISKGCDNRLRTRTPELVQFRFTIPSKLHNGPITLAVSVKYRKFAREYTNYVFRHAHGRRPRLPIILMAERKAILRTSVAAVEPPQASTRAEAAHRWQRYGLALLGQGNRRAVDAFARAAALDKENIDLKIDTVEAELSTERALSQTDHAWRALAMLDAAFPAGPLPARARYWKALALLAVGDGDKSIPMLRELAEAFPKDSELHRRLGLALAGQKRFEEARRELEIVTRIDPLDGDAYESLLSVALAEDRTDLANEYGPHYWVLSRFADPSVDGACDLKRQ